MSRKEKSRSTFSEQAASHDNSDIKDILSKFTYHIRVITSHLRTPTDRATKLEFGYFGIKWIVHDSLSLD